MSLQKYEIKFVSYEISSTGLLKFIVYKVRRTEGVANKLITYQWAEGKMSPSKTKMFSASLQRHVDVKHNKTLNEYTFDDPNGGPPYEILQEVINLVETHTAEFYLLGIGTKK